MFVFLIFSLPTNQMAVRFQTQGSGRQSRNKIAFLGRGFGLTRCQIKSLTHALTCTQVCTYTYERLFLRLLMCVCVCVSKRVHVFGCQRSLWGGEVMYRNLSQSTSWWNTAPLLRSTAQTLPRRLIQGLMNVWLVYYPSRAGTFIPRFWNSNIPFNLTFLLHPLWHTPCFTLSVRRGFICSAVISL